VPTNDFFGQFAPLFGEGTPYLSFLHLVDPPVGLLESAIARCGDNLRQELIPLLEYPNWRPQLVAIGAMLVANSRDSLPELWAAIDRPSWVAPQLAATASILDTDFEPKAKLRLERGCRLEIDDPGQEWTPERHSAMGPSSWTGHSAKLMASLAALYDLMFPDNGWLSDLLHTEDMRGLMAQDIDRGGELALGWREKACELLIIAGKANR
jgi:hypothetical protein